MRTNMLNKLSIVAGVGYVMTATSMLNAEEKKPNFLLIFADDLGYGDVSYQGGDVPTPYIDSIAKNGVIFTDGYVTCPVCAPSRAGLMTGRYQQSFGFWDNIGPYRVNKDVEPGIPIDIPIMSERLKKLGYTCGLFGKTHGGEAEEMMAFNRWDEFYGFNNGASCFLGDLNRSHNPIFHNKKIVSSPYLKRGIAHKEVIKDGVIINDAEKYLTDKLGEMAVKFIEKNKDKPFLCYMPFNAPHGPFQAPKAFVDNYFHIKNAKRRKVMAMIESLDNNIGRVLEALKKNNLMDNTMIVFLSDNGGHAFSPNKPLRGKKATFWEGGLRIPFCMQWNGHIKPGQKYSNPVISLDILPTFIAASGGKIDPAWKFDGVNLIPYLTSKKTGRPHDILYWVWTGGQKKAIRDGDIKVVTMNGGRKYMMFDLSKDISEKNDISKKYPEKLKIMVKKHQKWESGLIPQQFGWNKKLGYKNPNFGKPQPYHNPEYKIK